MFKLDKIYYDLGYSSNFGPDFVEITIPAFTVSEANGGVKHAYKKNNKTVYKKEHWSEANKRHKTQKSQVHFMLRRFRDSLGKSCKIELTRYAPDKLDKFDNLPMSLKWILDATCEVITGDLRPGRADADERILDVKFHQEVSPAYGVKIRIINQE